MPSDNDTYFDAAAQAMQGVADFDWYGSDGDGCIAVLTTAGNGPIPKAAVVDRSEYYRADDCLARNAQPFCDATIVATEDWGDVGSWIEAARGGLYAFDYAKQKNASYWLIARPASPRKLATLPPDVQKYLDHLRLTDRCFSTLTTLRPDDTLEIVGPLPPPPSTMLARAIALWHLACAQVWLLLGRDEAALLALHRAARSDPSEAIRRRRDQHMEAMRRQEEGRRGLGD